MQILMLCERFPPDLGGLARSGARIAGSLCKLGVNVHVLAWSRLLPPGVMESCPAETVAESARGAVLHRLGRFSNWDLTLQHTLNVVDWMNDEYSFDAVWGHYLYPAGFMSVMCARKHKLKSIVSARGNDVDQMMFPPGDFSRLTWTLNHADAVTSVSNELAEKMRWLMGDDFSVHTILNCVDLDTYSPGPLDMSLRNKLGILNDEVVLGFSGELRHKKGLPFLPDALAHVRKGRPACLLIIGEVRVREQTRLTEFSSENSEDGARIISTGRLDNPEEVAACLRLCDIVLQPSIWDGLPNALLEAMACEKLVIASDAGGIPEVVNHQENGILIPTNLLNHLGRAILEALDLPETTRSAIQREARKTVELRFHYDQELTALGQVLESIG